MFKTLRVGVTTVSVYKKQTKISKTRVYTGTSRFH